MDISVKNPVWNEYRNGTNRRVLGLPACHLVEGHGQFLPSAVQPTIGLLSLSANANLSQALRITPALINISVLPSGNDTGVPTSVVTPR